MSREIDALAERIRVLEAQVKKLDAKVNPPDFHLQYLERLESGYYGDTNRR